MKFAISIFSTLVIIIGAILFVQYQVHSDQVDAVEEQFEYSQEIEVVYRAESLDIRHHFKNLPEQAVSIQLPEMATSFECFLEAEYSCERLDLENSQFSNGQKRTQSISYVVPVPGGLTGNVLLENIFAQLNDGNVQSSIVHISTDSGTAGQWVTGLPLIGEQQLSLVNYAMFSGKGEVRDLYWDSRDVIVQSIHPSISLYSEQPLTVEMKEQLNALKLLDNTHISIVQSNVLKASHRIMFMPEITVQAVHNQILMAQLESYYDIEPSLSAELKQVLLYYLTEAPVTSNKASEMIAILNSLMSESQVKLWKEALHDKQNQFIAPETLDEILSKVLGNTTNYFMKNNSVEGLYPFYFVEGRELFYNNKPQDEFEVIFYEGRVLYKAQPFLTALGYNAYEGENGYYVNNDTRVFRFPQEHGFYVFNQRRYNTGSDPIIKIENEYYIEEVWMQRLFLVEVSKNNTMINIKSMDAQTD